MENMKATGIVRKMDELGRWVIPMELRKTLKIKPSDRLELYVGPNNELILKKYMPLYTDSRRLEELIEVLEEKNVNETTAEILQHLKEAKKCMDTLQF